MTTDISIRAFDHGSDTDWNALQLYRQHFAYTRKQQYVTPFEIARQREIGWARQNTFSRWIATDKNGVIAGSSSVQSVGQTLGFRDGLNLVFGNLAVLPEFRRCGIGTALLAPAVEQADKYSANRRLRFSSLDEDGASFAEKRGFSRMRTAIESELHVDSRLRGQMDSPELEQRRVQLGLELQTWNCLPPTDIVRSLLHLYSVANHEGNYVGNNMPPRQIPLEEFLNHCNVADSKGDTRYTGILLDREGSVVALSIWKWSPVLPGIASSVLTGVAEGWRKKGLARYLRSVVVRQILVEKPAVRTLISQVWSGNEAMKECNKRSGFTPRFYFNIYDHFRVGDRMMRN